MDIRSTKISRLSITSFFSQTCYNSTQCAAATAFLYERDGRMYLVSNWHVFSGRHSVNKQPLRNDGGVPNNIKVHHHLPESIGTTETQIYHLMNGDDPLWWEHPDFGSEVDIGVLEIAPTKGPELYSVQLSIGVVDPIGGWGASVGEQVFVLGFPLGIEACKLPIWKAATVASEPELDVDAKPLVLIDTATREGMSGSPVFEYVRRPVAIGTKEQIMSGVGVSRFRCSLIGVYSGRLIPENQFEAQIGYVWKAHCIDEIIDGKQPAKI